MLVREMRLLGWLMPTGIVAVGIVLPQLFAKEAGVL